MMIIRSPNHPDTHTAVTFEFKFKDPLLSPRGNFAASNYKNKNNNRPRQQHITTTTTTTDKKLSQDKFNNRLIKSLRSPMATGTNEFFSLFYTLAQCIFCQREALIIKYSTGLLQAKRNLREPGCNLSAVRVLPFLQPPAPPTLAGWQNQSGHASSRI